MYPWQFFRHNIFGFFASHNPKTQVKYSNWFVKFSSWARWTNNICDKHFCLDWVEVLAHREIKIIIDKFALQVVSKQKVRNYKAIGKSKNSNIANTEFKYDCQSVSTCKFDWVWSWLVNFEQLKPISRYVHIACSSLTITSLLKFVKFDASWLSKLLSTSLIQVVSATCGKSLSQNQAASSLICSNLMQHYEANRPNCLNP